MRSIFVSPASGGVEPPHLEVLEEVELAPAIGGGYAEITLSRFWEALPSLAAEGDPVLGGVIRQ